MRSISLSTLVLAFGVGLSGTLTALLVKQSWADRTALPTAMPEFLESQYPDDFKSVLEIGSRFPDEVYSDLNGIEHTFYRLFDAGSTVLLFWSPLCPSCVDQAVLWDSVMQPALLPKVREVVCLPRQYINEVDTALSVIRGKEFVFYDEERFASLYKFIVVPTIIAVDRQGFLSAIQYEYSQFFTEDLIESVTRYEVGPCVPMLSPKGEW